MLRRTRVGIGLVWPWMAILNRNLNRHRSLSRISLLRSSLAFFTQWTWCFGNGWTAKDSIRTAGQRHR